MAWRLGQRVVLVPQSRGHTGSLGPPCPAAPRPLTMKSPLRRGRPSGVQPPATSPTVPGARSPPRPHPSLLGSRPATGHLLVPPWGPPGLGGQSGHSPDVVTPHLACAPAHRSPVPSASGVALKLHDLRLPSWDTFPSPLCTWGPPSRSGFRPRPCHTLTSFTLRPAPWGGACSCAEGHARLNGIVPVFSVGTERTPPRMSLQ